MSAGPRLWLARSPAAFVAQLLHFFPIEGRATWIFSGQLSSAFPQLLKCRLNLILVGSFGVWDEASSKRVLSLKGPNLSI
jgi:hypothetical protein